MKMAVCTVTRGHDFREQCIRSWGSLTWQGGCDDGNLVGMMNQAYRDRDEDILCYLHDDVIIHEQNWQERVLKQFEDPKVGVVGFGGSLWHGSPDIYKVPYHISQMGRSYYMSNTDDAEVHGARFTGERYVSTVDGFALVMRSVLLGRMGGWPVHKLVFHGYDHWATLAARRLGFNTRICGVRCCHLGGQTYTKVNHDPTDHERAHKFLYNEFRDVLPVMVKP